MAQNTSNAVMASRIEANDSLDFFPTMPWATRALCERLDCEAELLSQQAAWEPACGAGDMARPLAEYFGTVHASDVHDYGFGKRFDFLWPTSSLHLADWIITNPPFRLAQQFALRALADARRGVALLVRTAFLEGGERYRELFEPHPPWKVFQFVERVPMIKGRLSRTASTATSYCWVCWRTDRVVKATRLEWIQPCRRRLERDSDYPLTETTDGGAHDDQANLRSPLLQAHAPDPGAVERMGVRDPLAGGRPADEVASPGDQAAAEEDA